MNTPLPALLFAAFATLAAAGCTVSLDLDDDTTRRVVEETVPTAGLTRVDIRTDNGEVEVVDGVVDDIEIRVVLQEADEGDAEYSIDTDGDRLLVVGECDARWWQGCKVGFRVVVPADFDVAVDTDNGRIGVDAISGTLDLETDNGAIEADGIDADEVSARTDNGRIRLAFDTAPSTVEALTDNGAIVIRLPDDGERYDVSATSDNGHVDVDIATGDGANRRVVADSDNGAIDIEYLNGAD